MGLASPHQSLARPSCLGPFPGLLVLRDPSELASALRPAHSISVVPGDSCQLDLSRTYHTSLHQGSNVYIFLPQHLNSTNTGPKFIYLFISHFSTLSGRCMCLRACWGSEDNYPGSLLSFHHMGPGEPMTGHQTWQQVLLH